MKKAIILTADRKGGSFVEIRVLRYFLAVAREGSVTAAANTLHITQPTLSRQLMELEAELGKKLFDRSARRLVLTPDGMLLRKRAEDLVELMEKTEAELRASGEQLRGDIYIGGGETEAMSRIAAAARLFRSQYPDIHFHLYSGNANDVVERLEKGLLDFGLLIQPFDISRYDHISFPDKDVWGLIMRTDHPLAAQPSIRREELLGLPLLFSRQAARRAPSTDDFHAWFGADWSRLNIIGTFNLIYNAALMVKAGVGCAVSLDRLADTSEGSGLCFRPLEPRLEAGLDLVWKKHAVFSAAAELFLDTLRRQLAAV